MGKYCVWRTAGTEGRGSGETDANVLSGVTRSLMLNTDKKNQWIGWEELLVQRVVEGNERQNQTRNVWKGDPVTWYLIITF